MSRGVNKVILVGHLGQDPEVKYMTNGNAVANISIATSEQWTDKQTNERREQTEWHRVVFFNRMAEIVGEYLRKGSQVYVEGRLQTRKWTDKDNIDRYSTEIVANNMQMLGSRGAQQSHNNAPHPNAPQGDNRAANTPPMDDFDDDIPF